MGVPPAGPAKLAGYWLVRLGLWTTTRPSGTEMTLMSIPLDLKKVLLVITDRFIHLTFTPAFR